MSLHPMLHGPFWADIRVGDMFGTMLLLSNNSFYYLSAHWAHYLNGANTIWYINYIIIKNKIEKYEKYEK